MALHSLITLLLAVIVGALAAAVALPRWLPDLSASLLGAEPSAYWLLSRSSAVVSYLLLWLSMAFGLAISGKLARLWPGGPAALALHQHTSLLGLAFGLFHALMLLGDRFINYGLAQVLVPFASSQYKPLAVGLGQVALYLLLIVILSFYLRPLIGRRAWRLIHYLSFLLFGLALLHGVFSGSDSASPLLRWLYWGTGGSLVFLTIYRILMTRFAASRPGMAKPRD